MFDDQKNTVFKYPLWLAVLGECREQLSLISIYNYYASRYNIEHFFRFGKNNLLLDEFQTSDTEHEEQWWRLCMLAYNQLYLSRCITSPQIRSWEKYLPKDPNNPAKEQTLLTPSQTQRDFATLLAKTSESLAR